MREYLESKQYVFPPLFIFFIIIINYYFEFALPALYITPEDTVTV